MKDLILILLILLLFAAGYIIVKKSDRFRREWKKQIAATNRLRDIEAQTRADKSRK